MISIGHTLTKNNLHIIEYWKSRAIRPRLMYTRLSAEKPNPHGRMRSIVLRKLENATRGGGDTSRSELNSLPGEHVTGLQMRLLTNNLDEMDVKKWNDWILSAPSDVLAIRWEKPQEDKD